MSDSWNGRVTAYVDKIQQLAETIDLILERTDLQTTEVRSAEVAQSTLQLQQALTDLEERIAEREQLLHDVDAPAKGLTLTEKLAGTRNIEDAKLAQRCREVAEVITTAHHRAIALFVCQYHLAGLTSDIVRLLSGSMVAETYGPGAKQTAARGGGIFNEAA